ncbi:MAG: VanZ family protein [Acidobacteria bacterium]|nr:VanZ family protein [Acidobacteriota bacterium]MCA1642688.1 VanZ family protein [Acidobacteriota bacterium]
MAARSNADDAVTTTRAARAARVAGWRGRAWRYAPLLAWTCFIFYASTGAMSASNTSRVIEPLLRWLVPDISAAQLVAAHAVVRKLAHFGEYALLALLAARAFAGSAKSFLSRRWFAAALAFVVAVALLDEFNQSFNPARTGTIKDSLLDAAGGLTALLVLALLRARRARSQNRLR